jgi:hypothetical protein
MPSAPRTRQSPRFYCALVGDARALYSELPGPESVCRGDAPQFLSICHILEFEPIYREEAKGRTLAGKKTRSTNGAEGTGQNCELIRVDRGLYIHGKDNVESR